MSDNNEIKIQDTQKLKEEHQNTIRELPVLPSKDVVLFPHMVVPWVIEPPNLVRMIDDALASDRTIAVVSVDGPVESDEEIPKKLHKIGTMGLILRMAKNEQGHARLVVQGITRVRIKEITATEPYIKAKVEAVQDKVTHSVALEAMVVNIRQAFSKVLDLSPNLPSELRSIIMSVDDPGVLADVVISHINVSQAQKQEILEELDVMKRLEKALKILSEQLEILELGHKIQSQVRDQVDRSQREYFLREQLKAIKKELGESEEQPDEIEELREKLKAKNLPEEARKEAERELERLARMHPSSSEYTVARTYLDWILELPWNESTEDNLDLDRAEKILNEDHYDLEKVKKRIIEYLAVRKLKPDAKGPILCFVGPPGTGKTSLGKSIARAIGRKFYRIALGGVRDEAEIRGHRRTYIGAMPGRIIQGLRKVGVNNPVMMLDEIDKIGTDFRGDPASALLEVLDPEQNSQFTDHYLGVEFDLSKIIFIATANVLETIPAPLLDRMEVLELSGYTLEDKIEIAKRYLIPRQLEQHGLTRKNLTIEKRALVRIISEYTREAGVRNLERQIGSICRAVARMVAQGHQEKVVVKVRNLEEFLGKPRYLPEVAERTSVPGVATGLAWTPVGGDILFVEATKMPGSGKLTLTGQLGDVMKESAQTALSYVKSKACSFGIPEELFKTEDIHVHVPAGAIPKDGPSAGITITVALVSLFTDKPVRPDVAMTGEITLRGLVLPVGGIKEKVLAAHRAGIKEIILPKRNAVDLDELPEPIKNELTFHLVSKIDQAVKIAFKKTRRKKSASCAKCKK
ncbi:MAG: endopeptidase La [Thermodesulfobacteria bacterium]|nr:endopeptidase La [Thermodesulfobacteriota bacterium]